MFNSLRQFFSSVPTGIRYVFAALIFLTLVCTHPFIDMTNPASRFLTIEALVERGTFVLDEKHVYTDDKMVRDGVYYSSKAPLFSVIGAGLYWPLYQAGLALPSAGAYHAPNLAVYLIVLVLSGGAYFLLLVYSYRFLRLLKVDEHYQTLLLLGIGLGTLYFPFSITLNNHTPAGALALAAFYHLFRSRLKKEGGRDVLLAGGLIGLAAAIELPFGLTALAAFALYLFFTRTKRLALVFVTAALPALIIHAALTVAITGDLLPAQFHPEYGDALPPESRSVWESLGGAAAAQRYGIVTYSFNILFGTHGLFLYSPILVLAAYGLYRSLKRSGHGPSDVPAGLSLRPEAIAVAAIWLVLFLFYVIKVRLFPGSAFGFRWFIAPTPLLFQFIIPLFRSGAAKPPLVFLHILLVLSAAIAVIGYINPWSQRYVRLGDRVIEFPLFNNLNMIGERLTGKGPRS